MRPAGAPGARADVLLSDGSVASLRPAVEADRAALVALHERISIENVRLRFFSAMRDAGARYVQHVLDTPETIALVVERRGELVALGTAEIVGPATAEVAFVVADESHALGIGSLLLEHLAAAGRDRGIRRFTAEVLADNGAMLRVLHDAGFASSSRIEGGCVQVEMDTAASAEAVRAADERESRSEARSLRPVLAPRSVAVVGVRRDGSGVGAAVLRALVAGGFTGDVHVVHRDGGSIEGIDAVPSLSAIGTGVDLVVVAVPADAVPAVLEDAVRAGCRGAVVLSSGFAELGAEGEALQRRMLDLARASSMRLVGPNCLGLMNTDPVVRLNATFSAAIPPPGGLALASQSGGVAIVLADLAREHGVGVGLLVSLGNKVDISGNDLLAAWRDDPGVRAAGLYLESFGNAAKFARIARGFSERKPLLAVVGGRSPGGRRGGASHTAAAATPAVATRALFAQAGVLACETAEQLVECALLLEQQPRPGGRRVAIISNAGGMGVLAADTAEAAGLLVSELSVRLQADLAGRAPGTPGTSNPVDAGAGAAPEAVAALADELLASDEVDALLVVLVATAVTDATGTVRLLADVRRGRADKPVLLVPLGGLDVPALEGITTYRTAAAALGALARVAVYEEWRSEPHTPDLPDDPDRGHRVRAALDRLIGDRPDGGWLDADERGPVLGEYALVPEGVVVTGAAEAEAAAARIGYPVAVKTAHHSAVHRTEQGLVRTGLTTPEEVRDAVLMFDRALGGPSPVLVQPMVAGVEMAIGIVQDPRFGPLVMIGAGGVATEVLDDRTFLVPPVTARDASRAVRSLRVWPVLDGYRGSARADVDGLVDLLVRVARMAEEAPAVAELDLNPVVVDATACHLVDVKARLDTGPVPDAGIPRRLRRPS
ncbi:MULTISPECIES: GNAT family N-acetyltransferase [unclassified Nocardioides]|uniref:bifunctional acetate--CoA ligase family protein/GNAT family N-acetyltransferase n=1 Tax=unclassified Nocardioides TaxID=2615069 RepID=UPI00362173C4